jgi:hypothetical protein
MGPYVEQTTESTRTHPMDFEHEPAGALWCLLKGNIPMNSIIKALTVFTVALAPAAYAGTATSSAAPTTPPANTSTYSSQSTVFQGGGGSSMNPHVPGATGYSIVRGDNSTIAGDALATRMERTGAYGGE